MDESISMRKVRVSTLQKTAMEGLKTRFPDGIPTKLRDRVEGETDLAVLERWIVLGLSGTPLETLLKD